MLHGLITYWFHLVRDWGYGGVVLLMAMESSIFPVPSEVVIPPAAYWAAQGNMSFSGVIAAGTLGSYLGSLITFVVAQAVGLRFINRYGKYILLSPDKMTMAQGWVKQYGVAGIFFARLLPVVRHLISIPAGILKMDVMKFSVVTVLGSFLWCSILAWFGREVIGGQPHLLDSPEAMIAALKAKLHVVVLAIALGAVAYTAMVIMRDRLKKRARRAH